ncbi:MAG: CDP-diacylglycerol--glycerol-3-phosphate 3-phosphatidyltransferase, partial [Elusimicrobia bacterium]|nr:CDP-diacylglycerol--glycerol-3-phosphate 3-phosphatidyltransferase [Elusimicrobiota bacterium]
MTAANRLTMLRLCLIPLFLIVVVQDRFWTRFMALLLFSGAAVTDLYDGIIARRTRSVTTVGILLDPVADKLLISAALIVFVQLPELHIPAWMVILILSREFLITGLRSVAAARGQVLEAEKAGKFKTTSQVVSIIT